MSLPVPPSAQTILANGIDTILDVLLPAVGDDEWAKFNAGLLAGALEYALESMKEDRARSHREQLAAVLAGQHELIASTADAELVGLLEQDSPFEAASAVLIWCQNNPGDVARSLQRSLHCELYAQLDQELAAAAPIMGAFQRGMRGEL